VSGPAITLKKKSLDNDFGHKCDICGRLWFKSDLKPTSRSISGVLREEFPTEDVISFKLCNNSVRRSVLRADSTVE
jgi:hypothetical protein